MVRGSFSEPLPIVRKLLQGRSCALRRVTRQSPVLKGGARMSPTVEEYFVDSKKMLYSDKTDGTALAYIMKNGVCPMFCELTVVQRKGVEGAGG